MDRILNLCGSIWTGGRVRFIAPALKAGGLLRGPRVQISPRPPVSISGLSVQDRTRIIDTSWRNGYASVCKSDIIRFDSGTGVHKGEVAEWSKAPSWKGGDGETRPRVRIPVSPPINTGC